MGFYLLLRFSVELLERDVTLHQTAFEEENPVRAKACGGSISNCAYGLKFYTNGNDIIESDNF